MSPTKERDAVAALAPTGTAEALALARQISDPWFRCQALAHVARYASKELVSPIAREALDTALHQKDAYKIVAVSAWPVRAVIERDQTDPVPLWLGALVVRAQDIDHPVSKLEALFLLWQAAFPFLHSETDAVFEEFMRACGSANSWKAGSRLEAGILILASRDPVRAAGLVQTMRDSNYKRRASKRLSETDHMQPRPFFWTIHPQRSIVVRP